MSDADVAALVLQLVAAASGQALQPLEARSRDHVGGRTRQVACYLVHTGLGWPLDRTSSVFRRSRSTISHACRQVEERRDRPALDRQLAQLETVLREAVTLRLDL